MSMIKKDCYYWPESSQLTSGFLLPIFVFCSHCYVTNNWLHYKSPHYIFVNNTTYYHLFTG